MGASNVIRQQMAKVLLVQVLHLSFDLEAAPGQLVVLDHVGVAVHHVPLVLVAL